MAWRSTRFENSGTREPLVRRCHRVAGAYSVQLDTDEVGMVPGDVLVRIPSLLMRFLLTAFTRNYRPKRPLLAWEVVCRTDVSGVCRLFANCYWLMAPAGFGIVKLDALRQGAAPLFGRPWCTKSHFARASRL